FGDAAGLPPIVVQALAAVCKSVAARTPEFTAKVNGKAELGDEQAKVLLLESPELSDLHTALVSTGPVQIAQAGTEQFPEFIPHLTVDYGESVDALPDVEQVGFGRIALWVGDDRQEFELAGGQSFDDVMTPPKVLDEIPGFYTPEYEPVLYAAALTAAGTRKFDPSLHPRGPDGRFIKKYGIAKWLDKKSKKWGYGKVVGWAKGAAKNAVDVTLSPTDVSGVSLGQPDIVRSDTDLYDAPKVLAHLKKDDATSKKTGGQAGSNPGGFYDLGVQVEGTDAAPEIAPVPAKYYVKKAKTKQHGQNEQLANDLYSAAGVPVPMVDYDQTDGMIYSKLVGGKQDMHDHLHDDEWLTQVRRNFAVDAWLSNWDVFGATYDNVQTDVNGTVWRIDSGGALLYRAMGGAKGSDFGPDVPELKSLRAQPKNKPVYGAGMSLEDELDGANRVLAITPGQIKDLVANVGLSPSVADTLIARRKFIADHYKLDLPETLKPPDTDQPATAAPLIEPADLAKSQGLSRDWQPLTLTEAAILMRQGDRLRLPTGQTVTVGFNEDTGHPLDIIGQQNQMNALMSSFGGDADVHLNTATPGLEKPRPTHGATIKAGEVQGYRWQRGDRLMTDAGPVRVHGVAPNGTYALVSAGDGAPYTMALVGNKDYTALRWDAPATSTDVDGTEHTVTPPTDNTYGLAPAASEALQAELTVPKAATPGDKSMVLGDGTKASTGNAVLSKMDGKLYVFIKPKGPYAVVTDPNSEHPDEQLLKMASTMAQPGVAKGDLDQPKSANGIIPSVGMTAKAKDGHEGVITMVNPAGTFVFITDSTGKKKRKSTKSVEILSQEPAAPVDTTPEPIAEPETPSPETPPVAEMPEVPAVVETPAEPELEDWEKELLEAAATTGPFITDDAAAPWTQLPLSKGDQVSADGGQTWQVVHSVAPALMVTADSDGSNKQTFWNENTTPFMHQPKGLADAADVGADPEGTKVEGLLKDLDIQVGDSILDQYTGAPTWVQIEEVENGWAKGHDAKGNPSSWLLNVNDQMTAVHGPDHISAETKKTQQAEGVFDGAETDPDTDKVISIVGPGPDATPTYWVQHSPGADWQMIEDGQIKFPGVPAEMIEDNYDYTVLQEPFPTPPVPEAAPEPVVLQAPEPQVVGVKGSDYALKPGEKTQDITTVKGDEFTVVYVGGDGNSLLHPVGVVHNGKFYGSAEDLPIDTTPVGLLKFADQVPKVKAGDLLSPDGFNWYLVEQTQWKKKAGGKYNLTHYQVRSLTSGQTSEWNWHSAPTIKWKPGQPLPSGVLPPNPDAGPQTFVGMELVSGDKVQLTGWNEGLGAGELYGQILTVQSVSPPSMYGGTGYTLVDDNGKEYLAGADALGFKVLEPTAPAAPPTVDTAADGAPKGTPSGVTGINHEPASFADFPDEVQEHLRTHPGTTVIQLSPVDKPDQFYLLDPSPEATGTLLFWNNTELIAPTKNGQQIPNGPAGLEALQKAVDQKLASGKSGHSAWTTLADVTPDDKSAPIQAPDQPAPLGDGMPELPGGYQLPPGFKAYKILDNDGEEIWVVQVDTSGNPLMPQGQIVYKLLNPDGKLDTSSMSWSEWQLIDSYDPDQLTEYVAPTPQITLKSWADATETVNGTPLNDYSKATLAAIAPNLQPGDTVWQKTYQDGTTLIVVGRSDGYHHTYSGGEIDDWAASSFNPVNLEEIAGPVAAPAPVFSTPESVDDALADLAEQLGGPPSTATPFPTPSAPLTEPPNWVFNKEFGDPDPADHYIKHFDSVWRKKPHEQHYIWYDAMDESWNPNVTAYPEEIADMANSGDPFEEWGTPPDSATPVATTTAAEFGGIAVTDGDIVIQGETGYLIKKSGDTAWHTYNLDGMEDKTVGYTDATATWAIEHADHTVVYGAFGGNVAPAGAGAGAATGVGVPSMKVTAENAVLPTVDSWQNDNGFTKDRIQKFLDDNDGQIPDGKV
ncbi:MAG TPA: hypothetical protein VIT65_14750, partial [Microlunatus sp.]